MEKIEYRMKVKELDDYTDYPVNVLSGMTGLGEHTIRKLAGEQKFGIQEKNGEDVVNGKDFLQWANSVGNMVMVEKGQGH
ncbi:hypothetical protein [Brevibacillus dissolubilis]|uniref:hypothetical protein n=1 Tax=Brevibacillus dissolubilis TaxID=1844116 RepID=UPI001116055E|nr:hypothetical protein [Brevibacillus dissolubilis]